MESDSSRWEGVGKIVALVIRLKCVPLESYLTRRQDLKNAFIDSLAQMAEQYTFNVWALGSNPKGITDISICYFLDVLWNLKLDQKFG